MKGAAGFCHRFSKITTWRNSNLVKPITCKWNGSWLWKVWEKAKKQRSTPHLKFQRLMSPKYREMTQISKDWTSNYKHSKPLNSILKTWIKFKEPLIYHLMLLVNQLSKRIELIHPLNELILLNSLKKVSCLGNPGKQNEILTQVHNLKQWGSNQFQ